MDGKVIHGDCLDVMRGMDAESVDAIVTDPPYGLAFMGKAWDHGVPGEPFWTEALRVAKPGAHLLAFGGTRTYHRLACAIEDAGWEIRDCIMWVHSQGFPKSHNVAIGIDKSNGAKHRGKAIVVAGRGDRPDLQSKNANPRPEELDPCVPATDAARQWQGFGTALKPAFEPVIVARKPIVGTVAQNVQRHGTGAINIDGCRIGPGHENGRGRDGEMSAERRYANNGGTNIAAKPGPRGGDPTGRFPANFIHDGSDEVLRLFPDNRKSNGRRVATPKNGFGMQAQPDVETGYGDNGSAARFFYCAKASKRDRDEGLDGIEERCVGIGDERPSGQSMQRLDGRDARRARNTHPCVKPTDLMRYLCRLVTPPGGLILDPFCGSGSTGKAAMLEGFRFVGIEREENSVDIARRRVAHAAG